MAVRRQITKAQLKKWAKEEFDLLNQLWPLKCRIVNLFLPQQKLRTKTRTGAKVTKTYDTATTPYTRLRRLT